MKKHNFKEVFGYTILLLGFIGAIITAVISIILAFKNPDMTPMRRFLEYPQLIISEILCVVAIVCGNLMAKD